MQLVSADPSRNGKVIKEAENLTLLQDRELACATLFKAYKKADPKDAAELKEKLFYFAKYYYTDKGFQAFLSGKEFLDKQKYQEAVEKLSDADELEKNNTEVMHHLSIAYLWVKKTKEAMDEATKSLQINPLDIELLKDKLAAEVATENWSQAILTADELIKERSDSSFLTYYFRGLSYLKNDKKNEARQNFEMALSKEKKYAEIYYWLSSLYEPALAKNLMTKYDEICKNGGTLKNQRDPGLCSHSKDKNL